MLSKFHGIERLGTQNKIRTVGLKNIKFIKFYL